MKRAAVIAMGAAWLSACVLAQPDQQKMTGPSTVVFGSVANDKGGRDLVDRGGAFFIDSRHVVTSLEACCGKTDKGAAESPTMPHGQDNIVAKVIWSSVDADMAIVELPDPFNNPSVTIAPSQLQKEGEAVYSVQYPKPGEQVGPQVVQGKMTGPGQKNQKIPLWVTTIQMLGYNRGGALFDACGNVIGVNYGMKDSEEYAFQSDVLIEGLKAAGVQANITSQPCGGGSGGGGSGGSGGGGSGGGGGGGGGGTRGKGKEESPSAGPSWMPQGEQWFLVLIVLGLVVLAVRPARQKVAQVVTGRYQTMPEPAPYQPSAMAGGYAGAPPVGGAAPMGYAAPAVPYAPPAYAPGVGLKPVLRGIAGQYAGSSFPLESGASTLGRDPHAANLVFGGDASSVSKRHCSVRWDAGRGVFLLEDHGSTNGTFLASGERLTPNLPRELRAGERFYIGDLRNQFEVAMEA